MTNEERVNLIDEAYKNFEEVFNAAMPEDTSEKKAVLEGLSNLLRAIAECIEN